MSGFISEPERSHEEHLETTKSSRSAPGGSRDQTHNSKPGRGSGLRPYEQDEQTTEMEISAGQKMLSAMSGSLLTSLLGMRGRRLSPQYVANPPSSSNTS